MFKYIQKIEQLTADKTDGEALFEDWADFDATVLNLILIGECVAKMTADFKKSHPQIPWRLIKDFRNYAVHNYEDVDPEMVWEVAKFDIPKLAADLRQILAQ